MCWAISWNQELSTPQSTLQNVTAKPPSIIHLYSSRKYTIGHDMKQLNAKGKYIAPRKYNP